MLYCAAALAMAFFAGSCQQENLEPVAGNGTVTFTVEAPANVQTRAIADGQNVDQLVYEVWLTPTIGTLNGGQKLYQAETEMVSDGTVNKATLTLDLVNDQKFTVLFWAQVDAADAYNTNDLTAVTYAKNEYMANDESLAAFYAVAYVNDCRHVKYDGTTPTGSEVKLRRPFAQLNIGTLNTATDYTVSLVNSEVTVSKVNNIFNVATSEASSDAPMTFHLAAVPNDPSTLNVNGVSYQYAGMNYMFAGDNVTVDYKIETKIIAENGSEMTGNVTNTVSSVPLKENYRTNIVGNLLTSKVDYQIVVDAVFYEPDSSLEPMPVATAQSLQEAINAVPAGLTGQIQLTDDIDLADLLSTRASDNKQTLTVPNGTAISLDLNGYSLTAVDNTEKNYSVIDNRGELTIVNTKANTVSKITTSATVNSGWNRYSAVLANNPGGKLTVGAGVEIEHLGGTDMAYGIDNLTNGKGTSAIATVEGATVKSTYRAIRQFLNGIEATNELYVKDGSKIYGPDNKSIWMQDPSTNANTGKLVVEDGAELYGDVYLTVTAGSTEWPVEVSIADAALQEESTVLTSNVPVGYEVLNEDGIWIIKSKYVAKIGEKQYRTLNAAVQAVEDGGTITLISNEVFTENNRYNNGGWWDGLGYSGDKSFTIDLNGKTISQNDGALNDYLMWFKNDGAKANTITLKNGTMDAGTTAFCAIATSSSNKQTITINLENINLINNNSNGAVAKIRGGSVLNVNAGTVITGMNSYVGIEAVGNNTVVNVYDGAKIYQNGTSSYVGAIIGASYNATLNIYGGEGNSAKCGIIVMSTGATINISGGEWTANNDGTVAGDNNAVLVSQNNRYESGWACKSILNVTGGTFKGGYNCYGMGPGVEADDAQINIKGGNFNADPANYVVAGYEATENAGTYTVDKPAALKELEAALAKGGNVTLTNDVTLLESIKVENKVVLDLNGKTITAPLFSAFEVKAGGELTVKNGKVVAYESTVRAIGGKVIVESGEYTSTGTALDSPATYRYSLDCREGGELIINGGTFKSNNGMINVGSTVTINGGKFENIVEKSMTRHFAYVSAPLTINDGEFYGKANSSAGGCFFCGAAAGGDIQVNGGKFTSLWTSGSVNRIFEVYYGGTINVTGGMFNTNGGIATFVTENTDDATKAAYPYVAK